jgi:hypothetical protein
VSYPDIATKFNIIFVVLALLARAYRLKDEEDRKRTMHAIAADVPPN